MPELQLSSNSLPSHKARRECSLSLEIIEAKELHVDSINGCDPYCVVMLNRHEESRTRTFWNISEPVWNHELFFDLLPDFRELEIVVWDENRLVKDTPLGKAMFSREFLSKQKRGIEQWFPLVSADTEGTVTGEIQLEMCYYPALGNSSTHTLTVNVLGGRDLISKDTNGLSDPYVVLHLFPDLEAETTKATKVQIKTLNPKYNESFSFTFTGNRQDYTLHVSVWDWDRFSDDDFMGHFSIPLDELPENTPVESWFTVLPSPAAIKAPGSGSEGEGKIMSIIKPKVKRHSRKESAPNKTLLGLQVPDIYKDKQFVRSLQALPKDYATRLDKPRGSIRLKVKYFEEVVLTADTYEEMIQLMYVQHYMVPSMLGRWADNREDAARTLVKIFDESNHAQDFLMDLITAEIEATNDAHTIFRGNSMGTKGLDVYMKSCAWDYLHTVLAPIIKDIMTSKKPCEVDPTRLEKGESIEKNLKNLEQFVLVTFNTVLSSAPLCPKQLCELFAHIKERVMLKFNNINVAYTAISGFIFLRFFCPAILGPKLFGLWEDHADKKTARVLTLVAKTLQNLGNLIEFGYKEEYMKGMNTVIVANMDNVKKYIDQLCKTGPPPSPQADRKSKRKTLIWRTNDSKSGLVDYEKECSRLFQFLQTARPKLKECASLEEMKFVDRLGVVLDTLEKLHAAVPENTPMTPRSSLSLPTTPRTSMSFPTMPVPPRPTSVLPHPGSMDKLLQNTPKIAPQVSLQRMSVVSMKPNTLLALDSLIDDLQGFQSSVSSPRPLSSVSSSRPLSSATSLSAPTLSAPTRPAPSPRAASPPPPANASQPLPSQPPAATSTVETLVAASSPAVASPAILPVPSSSSSSPVFQSEPTPVPVPVPVASSPTTAPKSQPTVLPKPPPPAAAAAAPSFGTQPISNMAALESLLADLERVTAFDSEPAMDFEATMPIEEIVANAQILAKRASQAADAAALERLSQGPSGPPPAVPAAFRKPDPPPPVRPADKPVAAPAPPKPAPAPQPIEYQAPPPPPPQPVVAPQPQPLTQPAPVFESDDDLGALDDLIDDFDLAATAAVEANEAEQGKNCAYCHQEILNDDPFHTFAGFRWHSSHFRCSVCDDNLEGARFFFHDQKLFCSTDYAFAFICWQCSQPIQDEMVEVLQRKWHAACFGCADCGVQLTGSFMVVDGNPVCRMHYLLRIDMACSKCQKLIEGEYVTVNDQKYHPNCLTCSECNNELAGKEYVVVNDDLFCSHHFMCHVCNGRVDSQIVSALGFRFHVHCFNCFHCHRSLVGATFYSRNSNATCKSCFDADL